MFSSTFSRRTLLALLLVAVTLGPAPGQRLDDGEVAFEKKERAVRVRLQDLFKGLAQANASNKDDVEAAEVGAKGVTYRLVWRTRDPKRPDAGKINELTWDVEGRLAQMTKFKANTQVMQQLYCKHLIDSALEVIQKAGPRRPIVSVNAARMLALIPQRGLQRGVPVSEKEWAEEVLPRLAEGNGELLANACLTALGDAKTNDGARYYLFRALASLLGVPRPTPPLVKKETEDNAYKAALEQVEKKVPFPRATPRQEVEGYKLLRLQAVKVLAQARVPATGNKLQVALALARVAANDERIVPPPRLDERVEAVIGLARMGALAAKFPDYHADYASEQIGRAVADFGVAAIPNLDVKPGARLHPWKVDAARMSEALDALKADVKDPYVQNAVGQCQGVLSPLERGSAPTPGNLTDWLTNNSATNKTVYRDDPASTVTPRKVVEEPEEPEEKKPDTTPSKKPAKKPDKKPVKPTKPKK